MLYYICLLGAEFKGGNMGNMKSLYKGFKYYFDYDREKINYFLEVLKNVKEDKWEYECCESKLTYPKCKTKTLIYDNIKIDYVSDLFWRDNQEEAETIITVYVDNVKIFKTEDPSSELSLEIIDFIERAEKRARGRYE